MSNNKNKTNDRLNLTANDMSVSISGLGKMRSNRVKVAKNVEKFVEITWTYGHFVVNVITEADGRVINMEQKARSTKPAYSFAAYFEACGSFML
jgi:hypothetical protein